MSPVHVVVQLSSITSQWCDIAFPGFFVSTEIIITFHYHIHPYLYSSWYHHGVVSVLLYKCRRGTGQSSSNYNETGAAQ